VNTINEKGIVYTFDLLISVVIVMLIIFSFSFLIFEKVNNQILLEKNFFLEEKTIAISDALIKNNNSNSFLGISEYDIDKKRNLTNKININNLNFENIYLKDYFVKEISYKLQNSSSNILHFEEKKGSDCFSIERFVLINNSKALLKVRGCYE
jgi:hypothetical protein